MERHLSVFESLNKSFQQSLGERWLTTIGGIFKVLESNFSCEKSCCILLHPYDTMLHHYYLVLDNLFLFYEIYFNRMVQPTFTQSTSSPQG